MRVIVLCEMTAYDVVTLYRGRMSKFAQLNKSVTYSVVEESRAS